MPRQAALIDHDAAKKAAQYLLRHGLASISEVTGLCGRSRQIVHHWARELDAVSTRERALSDLWRHAMRLIK
jgi:hypothetical protein